jgi:hypothetical protein
VVAVLAIVQKAASAVAELTSNTKCEVVCATRNLQVLTLRVGGTVLEMNEELPKLLNSLAERFCERKAYSCLLHFMPAYFAPNGLTDGWKDCRSALAGTRAFCRDELKEDEVRDINEAVTIIDRMLTNW